MLVNPDGHSAMIARQAWLIASCVEATWDELRAELRLRQKIADLSDVELARAAEFTQEALEQFFALLADSGPSLSEMIRGVRAIGCFFELTRPDLGNAPVHTVVDDDHPEWGVYESERIIRFIKLTRMACGISREYLDRRIGAHGVVADMEQGESDVKFRHILAMIHALNIGLILIDHLASPP
jgi:hypothetical protein